ncbi:MAG: heparan-alpha-glucosaminide N-acetyltransferase domain-containing protein [Flavicella sp.]
MKTTIVQNASSSKRVYFIDIIRSVAILMMLEGHFITFSLAPIFRDDNHPVYAFWKFTRGLTAPIFFSISGIIFTYLLLKNKHKGFANVRLRKGAKRGFILIIIGFLLQIKLFKALLSDIPLFTELFYIYHVLHCIGTCMLVVILIYLLQNYLIKIPLGIMLFLLFISVFVTTPTLRALDYTEIPRFFENILITSLNTEKKVSVFPMFPWSGYYFFGGVIGSILYKIKRYGNSFVFAIALLLLGYTLHVSYYEILKYCSPYLEAVGFECILPVYEIARVGQVSIIIAIVLLFYKITSTLPTIPKTTFVRNSFYTSIAISLLLAILINSQETKHYGWTVASYTFFFGAVVLLLGKLIGWNKTLFYAIGQNTLVIYVVHVVILYEGFLGIPFITYWKASLSPFVAISGAILFVFSFVLLAKHIDWIENSIASYYRNKTKKHFLKLVGYTFKK